MITKDKFYDSVNKLKGISIYKDVSIKSESNIRIDALFAYKIEVYSFVFIKKLFELIEKYKKKYYIIGNCSNILFAGDYFNGVIIKIMPSKNKYLNIVSAGDYLNYLNSKLINNGIESLNFLSGVPCSMGGAIYMNAGAFNHSIKDIIEYVYALNLDTFKIEVFDNEACEFSYRDSYFRHHNYLILGAKIRLTYLDKNELLKKHHQYLEIRKNKLPLEYPNLGSIFKNPKGIFAGKLIEDIGLKGLSLGGAKVSEKHANVIVNYDNARYEDIIKLIRIIKNEIATEYKIDLELEIIIFK